MPIHPEYKKTQSRVLFVGIAAVVIGIFGIPLPIFPGFLFILLGFSMLSLHSRWAHEQLATLRAKHPNLTNTLESLESNTVNFFDLTTHKHEYTHIPRRDGTVLHALVEVSSLYTGVAVLLHSASGTMETSVMDVLAEGLRARGLTVVRFDAFNGIGESDGVFTQFTASGMYEDLEDVLAWAREQSWWHGQLVLSGHSTGGLVAGEYAANHTDEVGELILFAPTISGNAYVEAFESIDAEGLRAWKDSGLRTVSHPLSQEKFGLAYNFAEDAKKYDLVPQASSLTMPVKVLTGTRDQTSPEAVCRNLADRIGENARLVVLQDLPHTPKSRNELQVLRDTLLM